MKLLEAEPAAAPAEPPAEPPASAPSRRPCASCGAELVPGQDWCLSCGTAAGRLEERPGWRSAMTVLGLTLLLVTAAVGASVAALTDDPAPPAAASGDEPVAQAPPATAPPAPTTAPTTPGATGADELPKVKAPQSGAGGSPPSPRPLDSSPAPSSPRAAPPPVPSPVGEADPAPSRADGAGTSGAGSSPAGDARPGPPERIDLAPSAASVYDPYGRVRAAGVVGRALDGDPQTSWFVDAAPGSPQINIGYALALGESRGIRAVEIGTRTPGFRVEIYASDEATPPPAITDTRWAHITDRSDVGEDGTTRIVLGAGTSKYRTLLLWITQPPESGPRVRFAELRVFG